MPTDAPVDPPVDPPADPPVDVEALVALLLRGGVNVATAESLTGGLVGAALTSVAGSSEVYRGGAVTYATDLKSSLLGVPPSVVATHGVVSAECAAAMAAGVRSLAAASYGVSTTGVAGPDAQDGVPAGRVFVGVAGPAGVRTRELALAGDRSAVRRQTVTAVLSALSEQVYADRPGRVGEETPLG